MLDALHKIMPKRPKRGYTLVELAISTSIVSLLAVGGLSILEKKNDTDNLRITVERLSVIDKTVRGFIADKQQGYVPCPALPQLRENDNNFGRSENLTLGGTVTATSNYNSSTKTCSNNGLTNSAGAVPVKTLKLPTEYAYDGWGRKFTYVTADESGSYATFRNKDFRGNLGVVDTLGTHKTDLNRVPPDNKGAIYVIISHGANGRKAAYRRNNTTPPVRNNIRGLEQQNVPGGSSNIFVQGNRNESFDDIVVFGLKANIVGDDYTNTHSRFNQSLCYNAAFIAESAEDVASDSEHSLYNYYNAGFDHRANAVQLSTSAASLADLCENIPSAAFSPSNVTGLRVWLDATDILGDGTKLPNAAEISNWINKAGEGDARATVKPIYHSNGILGALPSIQFNGSSHYATIDSLGADLETYTIFAVAQPSTLTGSQNILSQDLSTSAFQGDLLLGIHPNPTRGNTLVTKLGISIEKNGDTIDKAINDSGSIHTNTPFIVSAIYDGTTLDLFKNSGIIGTSVAESDLTLTDRTWKIGSSGTNSDHWNGYIGEIVVYERAISSQERDKIYEYLANKWGVTLTGDLNSGCEPGLVYRRTTEYPEGVCECEDASQVYITSVSLTNACIPLMYRNNEYGRCVTAETPPNYDFPPPSTGMKLWLDGHDCSAIIVDDSDNVSQWRDKSDPDNNNNHVWQTTLTQQPKYLRNGETGFTHPFVEFDNTDDFMSSTNDIGVKTIFVVHKSIATATDDYLLDMRTGIPNSFIANNSANADTIGSNWATRYINGTSGGTVFSGNWQIAAFEGNSNAQDAIYLGKGYTGIDTYNGAIAEILAYSTTLSNSTRQHIESYLSQKWGIAITQDIACPGDVGDLVCDDLTLWLDANNPEDNGTHPTDGSELTTWSDRSGQNNHYIGGNVATFESDPTSQINSKPVVHMVRHSTNSAQGNYYTDGFTKNINNDALTLFAAVKVNEHAGDDRTIFSSSSSTTLKNGYILRAGDNDKWELLVGQNNSSWNILTSSEPVTLGQLALLTVQISNGSQSLTVNKGASVTASESYSTNARNSSYLGGLLSGTSVIDRVSANIAEIIIYDAALSSSDIDKVEDYLTDKWGETQTCPSSICNNLLLWFDASHSDSLKSDNNCSTGPVDNNSNVGCWKDRSGNNYHMMQSDSTKRPKLIDNALNSLPIVRFDGSNDDLMTANHSNTAATAYSFIAVYKDTPTNTQWDYFYNTDNMVLGKGGNTGVSFFTSSNGWSTHMVDSEDYQIATFILQNNDNAKMYLNGVEKLSGLAYTNTVTGGTLRLGSRDTAGSYFNGDMAELIGYSSVLNSDTRIALEASLGEKWGITVGVGPANIKEGLQIWLNANDASTLFSNSTCSTLASDGADIGCWQDKSLNSNHVTTSSTSPTYDADGFNNKRTVKFDGTEYLISKHNSTITGNADFSVFTAAKFDAANEVVSNASFLGWGVPGGGTFAFLGQAGTSIVNIYAILGQGGVYLDNLGADTDPKIISWIRSNSLNQRDAGHEIYINGTLQPHAGVGNHTLSVNLLESPYYIGADSATRATISRISEVAIYDRVVDNSERLAIEAALAARWGISVYTSPGNLGLEGIRVWLDAADLNSVYEHTNCTSNPIPDNGDAIACWKDKSGSNNHLIHTADTKPAVLHNTLNSRAVIEFTGGDDELAWSSSNVLNYPMTFFLVTAVNSGASDEDGYFFARKGDDKDYDYSQVAFQYKKDWKLKFKASKGSGNEGKIETDDDAVTPGQYYIYMGTANSASSGNMTLYQDNVLLGTDGYSSFTNSHPTSAKMGIEPGSGHEHKNADARYAEMIVYNNVLSTSDRTTVYNYLADKWGFSSVGDGSGGATGPYPGDVAGQITVWLDASDNSTLFTNNNCSSGGSPSNGAAIKCWKDKSYAGNNATNAGSDVPVVAANNLNNHSVLNFTHDQLIWGNDAVLDYPLTFFIVAKINSGATSDDGYFFGRKGSNDDGQVGFHYKSSLSGYKFKASHGGGDEGKIELTSGITTNEYYIFSGTADSATSGTMNLYKNNVLVGSDDYSSFSNNLSLTAKIGIEPEHEHKSIDGRIGELIFYNEVLSSSKRDQLYNYLANKWGFAYPGGFSDNLVLWYDAHDIDGDGDTSDNPTDGATITSWVDKSPSGFDASVHDNAPTYSTGALNGKNTVNFVRSSNQSMISSSSVGAVYAFVVGRFHDNATGYCTLLSSNVNAYDYLFARFGSSLRVNSNSGHTRATFPGDANYHIYTALLTSTGNVRRDMVDLTMDATNYSTLNGQIYLGRRHLDGSHNNELNLGGNIAEVLLYDADIGTAKRDIIENYLSSRWGISASSGGSGSGPGDITTDLVLWLDASDNTTLYTNNNCSSGGSPSNGAAIKCWKDKSSAGNNATSAGSALPSLVTNGLNSKNVLNFVDDQLEWASDDVMDFPFTFFIVAGANSGADDTDGYFFARKGDDGDYDYSQVAFHYKRDWKIKLKAGKGAGDEGKIESGKDEITDGQYYIFTGTATGATSGTLSLYKGLTLVGSDSYSNFTNAHPMSAKIGIEPGAGHEHKNIDGRIAEIVFYNTALSNADRTTVYNYLKDKWGL